MSRYTRPAVVGLAAVSAAALCALPVLAASAKSAGPAHPHTDKHVLLISVDGMHQSDLAWYVAKSPGLDARQADPRRQRVHQRVDLEPVRLRPGRHRTDDRRQPQDRPVSYYDVEYSHNVDEPGAACTPGQPATGGDVIYDSPDDALASVNDLINPSNGTFPSFDENGSIYPNGVDKNPAAIMNLKFDPKTSLNPATFPVDPKTCQPITPWDYLGDNTIFQVIHDAGLRTAWSDKHEVYASFNGPGSNGTEHRRPTSRRRSTPRRSSRTASRTRRTTTGPTSTPPPSSTTATRSRPS